MKISLVSLKSGKFLVGKGPKTFLAAPDPVKPSWYAPDFFLKTALPWHTHETWEEVDHLPYYPQSTKTLPMEPLNEMYDDMQLEKGVIYTFQKLSQFCPESAAYHLTSQKSGHFIYGTEGILGASPELLCEVEGGQVKTMALAGTAETTEELLNEKEQEEHAIVVKGIVAALSPYGKVAVAPQEISPYGALYHLKTPIHLHAEVPIELLIKQLHPTPALGAWPREAGKVWLEKWEAIRPRRRFGAPFGYTFPERGESRFFVAIRCVQWDEAGAALWAGAGVTRKSCFAKEKQEVIQKLKTIATLMGI